MISSIRHRRLGLKGESRADLTPWISIDEEDAAEELLQVIEEVVPFGQSTIVLFAAQFARTLAKYRHGESLVWRDSGCLLATIYLVAMAFDLHCCGLGISADPWISRMFAAGSSVAGVGGCLCGVPPGNSATSN